jgi:hypothetical protein
MTAAVQAPLSDDTAQQAVVYANLHTAFCRAYASSRR